MDDAQGLFLTVAIPTFKRPEGLARCVQSVLRQDPGDGSIEYLIIDNDFEGSAADTVRDLDCPAIRYVHEKKAGVVNARNRAVSESRAPYLAFIDDDELACEGWLAAVIAHVKMGVDASFGRVVPAFEIPPDKWLEPLIRQIFTRDVAYGQDADVSADWAHMGTGNSLFSKERCFESDAPFDTDFNSGGGEDTWLIRSLVERGLTMRWNKAAVVEECVPTDRYTTKYLCGRRIRQGQNRVTNALHSASLSTRVTTPFWIGVGVFQMVAHGARALLFWMMRSDKYKLELVRASGGVGKTFWWRRKNERAYAGDAFAESFRI